MRQSILIVDDDPHIRDVVQFALEKHGFLTAIASDGQDALQQTQQQDFTAIVLDITMPEMDGLEFCRQFRKTSDSPILFLSSRDDEIDRIIGFEIGGDDYLTKPFSPRELVVRIQAILRRTQPKTSSNPAVQSVAASPPPVLRQYQQLHLNTETYRAHWQQHAIPLTSTEFALLSSLMQQPHKVFSRDELMNHAYGHHITVSDRTIDSHIRRIRHKFASIGADTIIETLHGIGYKLGNCTSPSQSSQS